MEKWRKKNEFANNNKPQFNEFFLIYSFILDHKVFFFFKSNGRVKYSFDSDDSPLMKFFERIGCSSVLQFCQLIFQYWKKYFPFWQSSRWYSMYLFLFFIPGLIECLTDKILAIEWRRNSATNLYTSWNHSIRRTILWISTLSSLPRLTSFDVWRRRRCSLIATVCFALRCRSFENIKSIKLNFICI